NGRAPKVRAPIAPDAAYANGTEDPGHAFFKGYLSFCLHFPRRMWQRGAEHRANLATMAGTDREQTLLTGGPAIILVEPQLGENIGMVARAMANFGLSELRIVNPRDGWPSEKARAAAS